MTNKKLQGCARAAGLSAVSAASQQQEAGGVSVLSLKSTLFQPLCVPLVGGKSVISLIYLKGR